MKKLLILSLMFVALSQVSRAHEGHDKTPGAVSAPHGGVVKGTSQLYLELVVEAGGVKIFPLSHELVALPLKDLSLKGTVKFPKSKTGQLLKFESGADSFSSSIEAKGAYRYTLDLSITYKGKTELLSFQVEPQS